MFCFFFISIRYSQDIESCLEIRKVYSMNSQYRSCYILKMAFELTFEQSKLYASLESMRICQVELWGWNNFYFILKELEINFWRRSTFSICTIGFVNDNRFQTPQVCEFSIILIYAIKSYTCISELWVFFCKESFL